MKLPLSVLDLSPVGAGVAPSQAIRDSIALARTADALGYTRYWFAEHHNMTNIATSAPEVLIAHAAAVTTRIRLGAGGIMVPNHAPLHVVEVFRTLEALAPDRIDLGLGRAPGTDPVTAAALRRSEDLSVNHLLVELLSFERSEFPPSHPFSKIVAMPSDVPTRSIWMLGSTLAGAAIAAQFGLPYAFAGHFAMQHAVDAIAHYRARFQPPRVIDPRGPAFRPEPSAARAAPYAILAVTAVCADSDDEAHRLAAPIRVAVARNRTGRRGPIATVDEALAYPFTPEERAIADEFLTGAAIGSPATVRDHLHALARDTGADELMLSTLLPDLAARQHALALIAAAMA